MSQRANELNKQTSLFLDTQKFEPLMQTEKHIPYFTLKLARKGLQNLLAGITE